MEKKRFVNFMVVVCILAFLVTPLFGQKTSIKVDGEIIKSYITHMADDKYMGRKPNSPPFNELLDWAANNFKKWGLEPGGENGTYFQKVPLESRRGSYSFSVGIPKLVIDGREFFTRYNDFRLDEQSTPGKTVKGEIVFVGYGIHAPEKGLDEYAGLDVSGKIVFVFKGSPNDAATVRTSFGPAQTEEVQEEDWGPLADDSTKIKTAYAKGASGIMLYDTNPETIGGFRRGMRRGAPAKYSFHRDFIIVSSVNNRVYKWLFFRDPQESQRAFERRIAGIQQDIKKKKARSFATGLRAEIKGYESSRFYSPELGNNYCRNVIGMLPGSDRKLKNEYVVLGGHYDHLGISNGQIYNGADDNASGSAVVMEMARLMAQNKIRLKRTVLFCLWTGEEMGLLGSNYWTKNPTLGISMNQVVTNFNMDMVALGDHIGAPGALNYPEIWEIIKKNQDQDILDVLEPSEAGPGGSDYSGFIQKGIEALALMTRGGGGHPDYHDTGDDAEKCEPEILRKTGRFVLQGTINVGNQSGSLIIPKRQHIYDGMRWNIIAMNPELNKQVEQNLDIRAMMRRGGGRGWTVLPASSKDEMVEAINKKIGELKNPPADQQTSQMRMFRRFMRRRGGNMNLGIKGGAAVGFDVDLLKLAKNTLDFGRIDVSGDDGIWFSNGLTDKGKAALQAMEENNITLCLLNPTDATFDAVLAVAEKPFVVCGKNNFTKDQLTQINEKKVLVGVDFDPSNRLACLKQLEDLKVKIGDTDNLRLNLLSKENLDTAKKDLYMKLIEKGWSKDEIYALGGSGGRRRRR